MFYTFITASGSRYTVLHTGGKLFLTDVTSARITPAFIAPYLGKEVRVFAISREAKLARSYKGAERAPRPGEHMSIWAAPLAGAEPTTIGCLRLDNGFELVVDTNEIRHIHSARAKRPGGPLQRA
jgi:hypothetical protein